MSGAGQRQPVVFALVGGFLGAGKTTTLCDIAKRIAAAGQRVGLITNDQADDLVDTDVAKLQGLPVSEIAGGCFCCKFDALVNAAEAILNAVQPDVLLAEPVGSCTDLSATVLQPIKKFYSEWFIATPYSVLVDPDRVESTLLGPLADSDLGYLFRKQLEEADVIVLNKIDRRGPAEREKLLGALREAFAGTPVYGISALTGEGVDTWWQAIKAGGRAGGHILEVDYDVYAEAEAALGWLNANVTLTAAAPFDGNAFATGLLEKVRGVAAARGAEVGHIKLLLMTPAGTVRANAVTTTGQVQQSGALASRVEGGSLTFNARVAMPPEDLAAVVRQAVAEQAAEAGVNAVVGRLQSFRPGRPNPTHRFAEVVE